MRCPYCDNEGTKVTDSRDSSRDTIRRRRECLNCGERFTTYEYIEPVELYVVKKDGRRELYDRNKVRKGLEKACEKRPVSVDRIEEMVNRIEMEIRKSGCREVDTELIGEKIMEGLKELDQVAYIRFASVYRSFADITCFEKELEKLLKEKNR